jgi:hypothetical protein
MFLVPSVNFKFIKTVPCHVWADQDPLGCELEELWHVVQERKQDDRDDERLGRVDMPESQRGLFNFPNFDQHQKEP